MADRRQAQRAQPRRRVDIKRVAEEAGLSTATASRVLSNTGYASEASRARVTLAADDLGYQPDALPRWAASEVLVSLGGLDQAEGVPPSPVYEARGSVGAGPVAKD
jgi:hypothetical protein